MNKRVSIHISPPGKVDKLKEYANQLNMTPTQFIFIFKNNNLYYLSGSGGLKPWLFVDAAELVNCCNKGLKPGGNLLECPALMGKNEEENRCKACKMKWFNVRIAGSKLKCWLTVRLIRKSI